MRQEVWLCDRCGAKLSQGAGYGVGLTVPTDLLADFCQAAENLMEASSLRTQATAVINLADLSAQIITYHPDYDYNTGELRP